MENNEYGNDFISLTDSEGNEYNFELLDRLETEDGEYVALLPVYDDPQETLDDNGELVIVKVVEENGEEYYENIDDDDEYDTVADAFLIKNGNLFLGQRRNIRMNWVEDTYVASDGKNTYHYAWNVYNVNFSNTAIVPILQASIDKAEALIDEQGGYMFD